MAVVHIANAIIEEIVTEKEIVYMTVSYGNQDESGRTEQTRLVVNTHTVILDEDGGTMSVDDLSIGMELHVTRSAMMTRSIPPQAGAYMIRIINRPQQAEYASGQICEIDLVGRSFTTIKGKAQETMVTFNVAENIKIFDRLGREMTFLGLSTDMQVKVRHANFMTASIPPQTTAFEVKVL